jgi:hypothetical protein
MLIASVRGDFDFPNLSGPTRPMATVPTRRYMAVDVTSARIIDRGTTRLASLTS